MQATHDRRLGIMSNMVGIGGRAQSELLLNVLGTTTI